MSISYDKVVLKQVLNTTPSPWRRQADLDPTIKEMKKHAILWNTNHPEYRVEEKRSKACRESAKRIGITETHLRFSYTAEKLAKNVTYIKRKFYAELRQQDRIANGEDISYAKWKWFDKCVFLKNWKGYKPKYLTPTKHTDDLFDKCEEVEENATESEDEVPESTTAHVANTEANYLESEDEALDSPQVATEDTMDPESEAEPDKDRDKKQIQINCVCESLSFLLSDDQITEDDVVDFHSDVIAFTYSFLKKKRRK